MIPEHLRDAAMTAAIFGLAGAAWLGWAMAGPPRSWRPWVITGIVASYATLIGGAVLAALHWHDGTVLDAATSKRFGIVVGIEFVLAAAGAGILAARRRGELVPVWIALVVGVHFFPLAVILRYPWIHVVGALTTIAAVVAVPIARRRQLAVASVNGAGLGASLLLGGVVALVAALLW